MDAALKESAEKYHEELVELAVEQDEEALVAYLDVSLRRVVVVFLFFFVVLVRSARMQTQGQASIYYGVPRSIYFHAD